VPGIQGMPPRAMRTSRPSLASFVGRLRRRGAAVFQRPDEVARLRDSAPRGSREGYTKARRRHADDHLAADDAMVALVEK